MIENTQRAESVGLPEKWAEVIQKAKELYILRRLETIDRYTESKQSVNILYTLCKQ